MGCAECNVRLGTSRIWLGQGDIGHAQQAAPFIFFQTPEIKYIPWNDDFGPMNAASIIEFVNIVDSYLERHPNKQVVYVTNDEPRSLTNAAFLLGAYMILKHDVPPKAIRRWFESIKYSEFGTYRDASQEPTNFRLSLVDCWRALERAKTLRWFCQPDAYGIWGAIDPVEYSFFDNPLEGKVHVVIPKRVLAFPSPQTLNCQQEFSDNLVSGQRSFSPTFYTDIFKMMGVTTVVRLSPSSYDKHEFEKEGFTHFDLPFKDGETPSKNIVRAFFEIIQSAAGMVAVHCSSGLGRTGTLVALCLMRDHGFSAREAMGWLRIVRPGSVLGEQQEFLCDVGICIASQSSPRPMTSVPQRDSTPSEGTTPVPAAPPPVATGLAAQTLDTDPSRDAKGQPSPPASPDLNPPGRPGGETTPPPPTPRRVSSPPRRGGGESTPRRGASRVRFADQPHWEALAAQAARARERARDSPARGGVVLDAGRPGQHGMACAALVGRVQCV